MSPPPGPRSDRAVTGPEVRAEMVAGGPGERINARPGPLPPRYAGAPGRHIACLSGGNSSAIVARQYSSFVGTAAAAPHDHRLAIAGSHVEPVPAPATPARADMLFPPARERDPSAGERVDYVAKRMVRHALLLECLELVFDGGEDPSPERHVRRRRRDLSLVPSGRRNPYTYFYTCVGHNAQTTIVYTCLQTR